MILIKLFHPQTERQPVNNLYQELSIKKADQHLNCWQVLAAPKSEKGKYNR